MKCSLKDGLIINILLIVCITTSEGKELPLFLHRSSVQEKPMDLQQFRASINKLQDLDSFPGKGGSQSHRIVKKQMANCDYTGVRKSKRSVIGGTPEMELQNLGFLQPRSAESTERSSFFRKLKDFAKDNKDLFTKRTKKNDPNKARKEEKKKQEASLKQMEKEKKQQQEQREEECKKALKQQQMKELKERLTKNRCLIKVCRRIPDTNDYRCYYECEATPNGCLKLKHRKCPKGQFFSFKYLKCLKPIPPPKEERVKGKEERCKGKEGGNSRTKKSAKSKKVEVPEVNQDEPEPTNEWQDATQSSNQNIDLPNEFRPQKKPTLKIYHLRMKRKLDETLSNDSIRRSLGPPQQAEILRSKVHGIVKKHGARHHLPRSFVVRVNKKEDQITDSDENENDNDEDDEESDEEEEDDEGDDEDEDGEEEETKQEKSGAKESIKDLLRSAKAAVTNRARFEDPTELAISRPTSVTKPATSMKSKKSNDAASNKKQQDKKVLIDANIKVDGAISSVLKSFLKSKRKDKEPNAGFFEYFETIPSFGSNERVDSEMADVYEHLMLNNPRLKRYFLVNCGEGGN